MSPAFLLLQYYDFHSSHSSYKNARVCMNAFSAFHSFGIGMHANWKTVTTCKGLDPPYFTKVPNDHMHYNNGPILSDLGCKMTQYMPWVYHKMARLVGAGTPMSVVKQHI